jgi:hypothetical protein
MPKLLGYCSGALLLFIAGSAPAIAQGQGIEAGQPAAGPRIAQVKSVSGQASVQRGAQRLAVKPGDPLYATDLVTTGADGSIGITFLDNTVFSAGPGSELALRQFHFEPASSTGALEADVKHGTLSVVSGKLVKGSPGAMKIKTPTAVLNVRGTTFLVKVD